MKTRHYVITLVALVAPLAGVLALAPPAKVSGRVRLVACVVSRTGLMEAEVESTSDAAMYCHLRCDYVIRDATLSHAFKADIPARFSGRVGQFDTSSGRPGRYSGEVGACQVIPSH